MSGKKQTAVEWLEEAISKKLSSEISPYFLDLIENAKGMEREQIYSEEKVLDIFSEWFCYQIDEDVEIKLSFQKWFEQFKKK